MALVTCPECGREVSDQAASCPQCGYPIKASRDLWRVQLFLPNRWGSLESCAKSTTSSSKVEWVVRDSESIATKELFPRAIADEIVSKVCPPYLLKHCSTQLIPPDPGEALPELSDAPRCPKCGSYALKTETQGFSFGRAAFGTALLGPVGAVAGMGGGGSATVCSNCGHKF